MLRLLQVALALNVAFAVWFIAFRGDGNGSAPVVPDTQEQFSLDLKVVGRAEHSVVYAVEQRARPAYRILSFDPASGAVETVFAVPDNAIIYGIALSPDRSTLAVSYSTDFHVKGNGLWTLDLRSRALTEVRPTEEGHFLVDPAWAPDGGSIYATYVDRTGTDERLALAEVTLSGGSLRVVAENAILPAVGGGDLYYLTVDDEHARRSIGVIDAEGTQRAIAVGDGGYDLDHLLIGTNGSQLHVAVLERRDDGSVTLGTPAAAHGNHDVPSTWWNLDAGSKTVTPTELTPTIVYDAASTGDSIVSATREGLTITSGTVQTELIRSRAIRFATG